MDRAIATRLRRAARERGDDPVDGGDDVALPARRVGADVLVRGEGDGEVVVRVDQEQAAGGAAVAEAARRGQVARAGATWAGQDEAEAPGLRGGGVRVKSKIKKADDGSSPSLELTQNPDILRELSHERPRPGAVIVGFAAETGDATGSVLDLARAKLARKGCDLLVVNDVSGGAVFGSPDNEAVVLSSDGEVTEVPRGPKGALAHAVWDLVAARVDR